MAVLKMISEQQPNALYQIEHEKTVFGRHPNCQIVLDNAAVSRHHAQILESHGSYYIEDLRSRNGTLLNDQEVEGRVALSQGDTLKVCDYTYIFYLQRPEDDSTVIPSKSNSGIDTGSWKRPTKTFDKNETDGSDEDEVDDGERSSIISTLDTGSSSSLHLGSKPEMKLKAIVEISTSLGQVLDLDEALRIILDGLFTIYSQADEGAILLLDQNDKLTTRKRKSRRNSDGDEGRSCVSMTIAKKSIETRQAILSANTSEDSKLAPTDSIVDLKLRSVICAPLIGQGDTPLGTIQLSTSQLHTKFDKTDLDILVSIATQACLAIENARMHQALLEKRSIELDLDFATQVQLGFLPNVRPKLKGYDFYDYYEAAQRVGGDYFDYINLSDGRTAIAVADVAGKGLPAALLMARLHGLVANSFSAHARRCSPQRIERRDRNKWTRAPIHHLYFGSARLRET